MLDTILVQMRAPPWGIFQLGIPFNQRGRKGKKKKRRLHPLKRPLSSPRRFFFPFGAGERAGPAGFASCPACPP